MILLVGFLKDNTGLRLVLEHGRSLKWSSTLHRNLSHLVSLLSFFSPVPALLSSTGSNSLLAAMNRPPHQPPKPRILSACTAVILTKFSVSARFALSCASCEWRCARFLDLIADALLDEAVVDWRVAVG